MYVCACVRVCVHVCHDAPRAATALAPQVEPQHSFEGTAPDLALKVPVD